MIILEKGDAMSEKYRDCKKEIIDTCLRLEKIGYFVGTWGNISVKVCEGVLLTPSKVAYDQMVPEDIVLIDSQGNKITGQRLPTSEAEIHRQLHNQRKDIGAIIHSHSPYATAVSCLHRPIPPIVEELAQIIGGQVECSTYVPAGQHTRLAEAVLSRIGEVNAVLVANHGAVCCGRTLAEAFVTCQILEKAAWILIAANSLGTPVPIPRQYVDSERYRFLNIYGTMKDTP